MCARSCAHANKLHRCTSRACVQFISTPAAASPDQATSLLHIWLSAGQRLHISSSPNDAAQHGVTGVTDVTASTTNFFPGPPRTHALAGAAAMWQQRQLSGEELLGCPGQRSRAWSNPRLGQPAHPVVK
eukprot:1108619-Pelagomonas_calceolata.AAC.3